MAIIGQNNNTTYMDDLVYRANNSNINPNDQIEVLLDPLTITLNINIKYLNDDVPRLEKIKVGDWIDLYAAENVVIKKNTCAFVNLGIAMEIPEGYEAYILPRSSTAIKWGCILLNSMGVVDESYCGDNDWWKTNLYCLMPNQEDKLWIDIDNDPIWFMVLYNHKKIGVWILKHFFKKMYDERRYTLIKKGDKIAQFRITRHMPNIVFNKVDSLGNADRGGFGTTGEK